MAEIPEMSTAYERHMTAYRATARCDFDIPQGELFAVTERSIERDPGYIQVTHRSKPRDGRVITFNSVLDFNQKVLAGYVDARRASVPDDLQEYWIELDYCVELTDGQENVQAPAKLTLRFRGDSVDEFVADMYATNVRDITVDAWLEQTKSEDNPLIMIQTLVKAYAVGVEEAFKIPKDSDV